MVMDKMVAMVTGEGVDISATTSQKSFIKNDVVTTT